MRHSEFAERLQLSTDFVPVQRGFDDLAHPPGSPVNLKEPQMSEAYSTIRCGELHPSLEAEAWKRAGISRSHAYELTAAGKFPRPVKVGRASRFVAAEIDAWIEGRIAQRDAKQSAATQCGEVLA